MITLIDLLTTTLIYSLIKHTFNITIYVNHVLRTTYTAMLKAIKPILKNGRYYEIDKDLINIKNVPDLISATNQNAKI